MGKHLQASRWQSLLAVWLVSALTACGGGGGSEPGQLVDPPVNQIPIANAGPDQTVASAASVTLAGSGSRDADGSIARFAWTQTAGTTVTLSSASTANPSFTAPTTSSTVSLGFSLTVTDDRGATASDTVVINVAGSGGTPTTTTVSGRVTYDRIPFTTVSGGGLDLDHPVVKPARGITVQALSTGSPVTVLASAQTDGSGNYSLTVPRSTSMKVRARAETKKTSAPGWDFTVVDNTSSKALYVLDSAVFDSGTTTLVRDLHAASGWDGNSYTSTRAAAPFAILDKIFDAFQKVLAADATAAFPKLTINWSINNVPTGDNPPSGLIGTSYYSDGQLYILGAANVDTDEFDDHVIIHEWGHYFEDKLSQSDSIGGSHSLGDLLDLRLAFGEGFGNALSGIVTDDPAYRDSSGSSQAGDFEINVERNPVAANHSGWYSESSMQSILYDLYDGTVDGSDNLQLGFAPLYQVFVGAQKTPALQTSIFTFITALKAANPASATLIDNIVTAQRINSAGINDSGSNETNNADGNADVLPIYTSVTANGSAVTVCSTNVFGEPNKLSNRRFLSLTLPAPSNLTITASGDVGSDPALVLNRRGQAAQSVDRLGGSTETLTTTSSPAGTYVIEAADFFNVDDDRSTGKAHSCLSITVTAN